MLESLELKPLSLEDLPTAVHKVFAPSAPLPLRMMAAKALLPISARESLYTLYQLQFDESPEIRKLALDTLQSLELSVIEPLISSKLDVLVLDFISKQRSEPSLLEALALNATTSDATLMDLAKHASKELCDTIATNHVRLLRAPEIIEALYLNPATRMATLDRVLAIVKSEGLELGKLKVLQEALYSPEYDNAEAGIDEASFEAILQASAEQQEEEGKGDLPESGAEDEGPEATEDSAESAKNSQSEAENQPRSTRAMLIEKMNAPQRVRLALLGSREDRNILVRDARRIVYMSVIRSPKLTMGEISSYAGSRSMPDELIAYIANKRDWTRYYPLMLSLVNNPKCPFAEALAFMRQLRLNDLKALQRSKNIPAQLARQAQALYRQKSQGR